MLTPGLQHLKYSLSDLLKERLSTLHLTLFLFLKKSKLKLLGNGYSVGSVSRYWVYNEALLALIHLNFLSGILYLGFYLSLNVWHPFSWRMVGISYQIKKALWKFYKINVDSFSQIKNKDKGIWHLLRQNKFFHIFCFSWKVKTESILDHWLQWSSLEQTVRSGEGIGIPQGALQIKLLQCLLTCP